MRNWRISIQRHGQIDVAHRTDLAASIRSEEIDQPHLWMGACDSCNTLLKGLEIDAGHQRLTGTGYAHDDCTTCSIKVTIRTDNADIVRSFGSALPSRLSLATIPAFHDITSYTTNFRRIRRFCLICGNKWYIITSKWEKVG